MRKGNIIITPFNDKNLSTSSYDVCLGENFYREQEPKLKSNIFNIYNPEHVKRVWGEPQTAPFARDIPDLELDEYIKADDKVIMLDPGETILAHTTEFIGGRYKITTMMKARSSTGRSFILVCKCLHPDTLIRTAYGEEKKISDIKVGDALINATRYGQSKAARVKAVRRSVEPKRVVTVTTKSNRSIVTTEDHLFKISTSHGVHITAACDLRVGDYLPVIRQTPVPPGTFMTSPEEAALIGYFLAEGNWQKYRLSIAKSKVKDDQVKEIIRLFKILFPDAPAPIVDDNQIMYNSVDFAENFRFRYPEMCVLAENKRVPERVINCGDLAVVKAFLRTYMKCDAHMSKKGLEVEFTSRSEGLINDIAYLTATFGSCPTRFSKREGTGTKGPCTSSYYYGKDATALGHWLEEKTPRSWSAYIPDLMRGIKKKYGLTRAQLEGFDTTSNKSISRDKLINIWKNHDVGELAPYCRDIVWDKIEKLEMSEVLQSGFIDISLDVKSEDDALFALSNGLMTLNCAGWGDVGYTTRWTFEITNVSQHYRVPLLVNSRIAQIVFLKTGRIQKKDYTKNGAYQTSDNMVEVIDKWHPSSMLPKNRP
jgi:deoxycytidine triphosphate deaminase